MADTTLTVLLQGIDNLSGVVNSAVSNVTSKLDGLAKGTKAFATQAQNVSQSSAFAAMAVGAAMAHPLKQFAEYDEALAGLKTSMMDVNGVVDQAMLGKLDAYARQLGNTFKGNQADMLAMFYELTTSGVEAQAVLNGLGEATAQYATLTHQSYESVGRSFAKLANEMGITNKALYPTADKQHEAYISFADSLQRAHYMGVKPDDMLYALGRSAGGMKLLQQQGAEAFKTLVPFYTMLIRGGATGEKAGTNAVAATLNMLDPTRIDKANKALKGMGESFQLAFLDKEGNIPKGENFIRSWYEQAEKLQGLSVKEQGIIGKLLMGGGYDQQIWQQMVSMGVKGYDELSQAMARQAGIAKKNEEIQKTLGMTFENTMSMFENVEIDWVQTFANDLKGLMKDTVQPFLLGMQDWIGQHQELARNIGLGGLAFIGFSAATAIASGGLYVMAKALSNILSMGSGAIKIFQKLGEGAGLLQKVTATGKVGGLGSLIGGIPTNLGSLARLAFNPWVLAAAVTTAAIYKYWTPIGDFFGGLWGGIKESTQGHTSNMQKALSDTGTWFAEAMPNVTHYAKAIGDFFSITKEGHNQSWAQKGTEIGQWFGNQVAAIDKGVGQSRQDGILSGAFWENAGTKIQSVFSKVKSEYAHMGAGLANMGPTIMSGLGPVMEVGSRIKTLMKGLSPFSVMDTLMQGIPSMGSIKGLGGNFMGNISGMKEKIVGAFRGIGPAIASAFSNVGSSISGALGRAGSAIMSWVSSSRARMVAGFHSMASAAGQAMNGIGRAISGAFSRASSVMSSFISSARAKLVGGFHQIAASAGAAAQAISSRLQAAFHSALAAAGTFVAGVIAKLNTMYSQVMAIAGRMLAAGRRIVENIARGIESGIGRIAAAMSRVAAAIMSHMPQSPAKEGPLRNINRINIVGSIADTMKPAPIVKATERVAMAARTGLHNRITLPRGGSHKSSTTHFSPTINVSGGSGDVRSEVQAAIKVAFKEFSRKESLGYAH
jgi:hypothetical protein